VYRTDFFAEGSRPLWRQR